MNEKFKITNNQWKWSDEYELSQLLDLNDRDTLRARGKYLTEIIDENCKLSYEAFNNLPEDGKYILPYGPSSGKTTALRQLFMNGLSDYFLYATKLVEDVDRFYYDLVAQYYYETEELPDKSMINKYTSDNKLSIKDCQKTHILITTHERLYTDPPVVLYTIDRIVSDLVGGLTNTRSAVFIDEYIKQYTTKKVDLLRSQGLFANIEFIVNETTSILHKSSKSVVRSQLLYHLINPDIYSFRAKSKIIRRLIKTTSKLFESINKMDDTFDFKFNKFDEKSVYRAVFFLGLLCQYYSDHRDELKCNIIYKYNLPDFINKLYILDGTGDIIFKSSSKFKILPVPEEYKRALRLNHAPRIIKNSSFSRTINSLEKLNNLKGLIKEKFIDSITNLLDDDPNMKLLVYTWKSIKLSNELSNLVLNDEDNVANFKIDSLVSSLPKYIENNLPDKYKNRVKFITYQSGKERVTSEFADCNAIYILGKFRIPQLVINTMNNLTESSMSSDDFTKSLIVQAIYRTQARLNRDIDIYFSDDYSQVFVDSLMKEFYKINIKSHNINAEEATIEEELDRLVYTTRNKKYYDYLIDNKDKIINNELLFIPNNEKNDNFKKGLLNYLNKYSNFKVKYSNSVGGRGNVLSLRISLSKRIRE